MNEKDEKLVVAEDSEIGSLYQTLREILESARSRVARSVNSEMVQTYWRIGPAIVEKEQQGKLRADYGEGSIKSLPLAFEG